MLPPEDAAPWRDHDSTSGREVVVRSEHRGERERAIIAKIDEERYFWRAEQRRGTNDYPVEGTASSWEEATEAADRVLGEQHLVLNYGSWDEPVSVLPRERPDWEDAFQCALFSEQDPEEHGEHGADGDKTRTPWLNSVVSWCSDDCAKKGQEALRLRRPA